MRTRTSRNTTLGALLALAALLVDATLARPSHGEQPIRGLSLFPVPETQAVAPGPEVRSPDESVNDPRAIATRLAFPPLMGACLAGDIIGFWIGSVGGSLVRLPVWIATLGHATGGEWLDNLGTTVVATTCWDTVYVPAPDLRALRPAAILPDAP
ncbi:MAG: hypothetical protein HY294_02585 [Candidatus Rokubacteria bacterium]|nr:hypothetical protein [Candidatus Rokubacteria bacterium]MBI3824863.1 hypothetical protein [Candidatus Rokubacteria bacterium]